jgi:hypothetical protein
MNKETYRVIRRGETSTGTTWTIDHDGELEGDYATKEAAFEAIAIAASNAIKDGVGVAIEVPPREAGEAALGSRA